MTPFCLLAFGHNFRPPSGAKGWAMMSFRPTIGRKMGDTPITPKQTLIFAQLMGEYKRRRLNHDR